jgi:hypothetical protein
LRTGKPHVTVRDQIGRREWPGREPDLVVAGVRLDLRVFHFQRKETIGSLFEGIPEKSDLDETFSFFFFVLSISLAFELCQSERCRSQIPSLDFDLKERASCHLDLLNFLYRGRRLPRPFLQMRNHNSIPHSQILAQLHPSPQPRLLAYARHQQQRRLAVLLLHHARLISS